MTHSIFLTISVFSLLLFSSFKLFYSNNPETKIYNIDKEYYKKIKNILMNESNLYNDKYNRKIKNDIINTFCILAKNKNIGLADEIDNEMFNILYKELIEYQINTNSNL